MPDNRTIIDIIYNVSGTPQVKEATEAIKQSDIAARRVTNTMQEVSGAHAIMGDMSRREWMRTGNEAAYYVSLVASKTGALGPELQKSISLVTQLGESFMFGGAVGIAIAGVGTALSIVTGRLQEVNKEANKVNESFKTMRAEIEKWTTPTAIEEISRALSTTPVGLEKFVRGSSEGRASATALADALEKVKLKEIELNQAQQIMAQWLTSGDADKRAAALAYLADVQAQLNTAQAEFNRIATDTSGKLEAYNRTISATDYYTRQARQAQSFLNLEWDIAHKKADEAAKATEDYEKAIKKLGDSIKATVMGAIEKAAVPTVVTPEDLHLTELGQYKDKWDEIARRWDSISAKGMTGEFADAEAALKKLNMTAGEAATAFRDFSLFVKPEALEMVNWDALSENVEQQINQILGKQKFMEEAWKRVWGKLPDDQKHALEEMGIKSMDDLTRKALGLDQTLKVDAAKSAAFDKQMQQIRDDVLALYPIWIRVDAYGGGGAGGAGGSEGAGEPGGPVGTRRRYGGEVTFGAAPVGAMPTRAMVLAGGYMPAAQSAGVTTITNHIQTPIDLQRMMIQLARLLAAKRY